MLIVAASFVARFGSLATWVAWIAVVLALYIGYLRLRPGSGSGMSAEEVEALVGSGTPVLLHLYSNY